jgi:hypothetical protein
MEFGAVFFAAASSPVSPNIGADRIVDLPMAHPSDVAFGAVTSTGYS